jgi:DNA-binding response OmpR family regulator
MTRKKISSFASVEHLQLSELTNIPGHVVKYSDSHRLLLIDGKRLDCTPTEYPLLLCLLEQCGRPVPFACLVQRGLHSPLDRSSRHSLTQHIIRLRRKLHPFGMPILAVTAVGYQLIVEPVDAMGNQQETAPIRVGNAAG